MARRWGFPLIAVLLLVLSCSCSGPESESTDPPPVGSTVIHADVKVEYKKFALPFELKENQTELCCYSDAANSIFAVGSRNGKQTGPLYNTERLYLCNELNVIAEYEIDSSAYIISAVPYKDGILYVDYVEKDTGLLSWSLIKLNSVGKTVLDHGSATAFDRVPNLILSNGVPLYLWEEESGFGINRVDEDTICNIVKESSYVLQKFEIRSNGTYYCYLAVGVNDGKASMFIGNEDGIIWSHGIDGKITSFAITDGYAICGLGGQYFSVDAVNVSTGESKLFQVDRPLWRMSGSGDVCVCVDDNFVPYYVNINEETISELPRPEENSYTTWPTMFYSVGHNNYYARFTMDGTNTYYNFCVQMS